VGTVELKTTIGTASSTTSQTAKDAESFFASLYKKKPASLRAFCITNRGIRLNRS
jgi:hypothetical protein